MVKNGEIRLKMAISVAGVPPRSETVSHASPAHTRVLSGGEVTFLKALCVFLTFFKPFLGHFWPIFAIFALDQKADFPIVISWISR